MTHFTLLVFEGGPVDGLEIATSSLNPPARRLWIYLGGRTRHLYVHVLASNCYAFARTEPVPAPPQIIPRGKPV